MRFCLDKSIYLACRILAWDPSKSFVKRLLCIMFFSGLEKYIPVLLNRSMTDVHRFKVGF